MASESSEEREDPLGPTTTIDWRKWFYIGGATSGILMAIYFGMDSALHVEVAA